MCGHAQQCANRQHAGAADAADQDVAAACIERRDDGLRQRGDQLLQALRVAARAYRDRRGGDGDERRAEPLGAAVVLVAGRLIKLALRSEEHTSELKTQMGNTYAVLCLKKKNKTYIK